MDCSCTVHNQGSPEGLGILQEDSEQSKHSPMDWKDARQQDNSNRWQNVNALFHRPKSHLSPGMMKASSAACSYWPRQQHKCQNCEESSTQDWTRCWNIQSTSLVFRLLNIFFLVYTGVKQYIHHCSSSSLLTYLFIGTNEKCYHSDSIAPQVCHHSNQLTSHGCQEGFLWWSSLDSPVISSSNLHSTNRHRLHSTRFTIWSKTTHSWSPSSL